MMKETFYFSHDCNARNDAKLQRLQMRHGMSGIGCYWCIVEMLYEERGRIPISEYERITFELRTNYELVKSVIEDFNLFVIKDRIFYSKSVLKRLEKRQIKSEKAKKSISARWNKSPDIERNTSILNSDSNTNVSENDSNVILIKKSKVKESIIERENIERFPPPVINPDFLDKSLNDCFNELSECSSWYEVVCMNNHITFDKFKELLKQFFRKLQNEGETKKNAKDAKSHFARWLKIELKTQNKDETDRNVSQAAKKRNLISEFNSLANGEKREPTDKEILNF